MLEYLPKPFDLDELLNLVSSTFSQPKFNKNEMISDIPKNIYDSGPVVGKSIAMQEIYKISRIVNTNFSVLISGESGTGKRLIAKSIHDLSSKTNKFFIDLDQNFDNYSFNDLIPRLNGFTSTNINDVNDLEVLFM